MIAEELRIGNLVLRATGWDKNGVPFFSDNSYEVDSISSSFIGIHDFPEFQGCNEIPIKDLEPIPLTEEWLIKAGFEKDDYPNTFVLSIEYIYVELTVFKGVISFRTSDDNVVLKYVHQLQNLYFVLTDQELELKQ